MATNSVPPATNPPANPQASATTSLITWVIRGVLIFFLLLLLLRTGCNKSEKDKNKDDTTTVYVIEYVKKIHYFGTNTQKIIVDVPYPTKGVDIYPKGDSLLVTTASGDTYTDYPGVEVPAPYTERGKFIFQKKPGWKTTGFEIGMYIDVPKEIKIPKK